MIVLLAALAVLSAPAVSAAPVEPAPAAVPGPRTTFRDGVLILASDEQAVLRQAEDGSFVLVSAGPKSDADPEPGTVVFSMSQMMGTMLSVRSGLDKTFRYDAHFDRRRRNRTSTCAVPAHLMGFENWGESARELVLSNFRVVGDDEMVCN